jgi:aminoglycoside phosphotransferase (APT) family kinase protein
MRDDDRVCHGDFHPGNILIDGRKAVIIDWMNATRGNPLADVARTTILVLGAGQTDPSLSTHANAFVRLFHQLYLRYCFRSRRDAREEYRAWLPIAAAARLGEDVLAEEEKWLVAQAQGCKPLSTRSP